MQLALEILKYCMGEQRLQLRRFRLALHSNLVKVHRLVQAQHSPVCEYAGKAHKKNTDSERREKGVHVRTSDVKSEPEKSKLREYSATDAAGAIMSDTIVWSAM